MGKNHPGNDIAMAVREETLQIEGMGCNHCVKAVQDALATVEGVAVHAVEIGAAQISYDPDMTDAARIAAAIEDAGYTVPTPA